MENLRKRNRACALSIWLILLTTACAPIQPPAPTYGNQEQKALAQGSPSLSQSSELDDSQSQKQTEPTAEQKESTQTQEQGSNIVDGDQPQRESEPGRQIRQDVAHDQVREAHDSDTEQTVADAENSPQTQREPSTTGLSLDGQNAVLPDQENTALTQDDSPPVVGPAQASTRAVSFQQVQGDQDSSAGPALYDIEPPLPSYLIAGFNVNEYADFTPANGPGNPFQEYSSPRVVGVMTLVKKIRRFDTTLGYRGGVLFNQDSGSPLSGHTIQQIVAGETVAWSPRTTLLAEDYLNVGPGATFGSSGSGGSSASNLESGTSAGTSDYYGTNDYGGFRIRHLAETALGEIQHTLSPRANLVFVGAFSTTQYFEANAINSRQTTGLAGYNYELSPNSELGASYGYQYWSYPGSAATSANTIQLDYLHNLSPRISFSLAAGPQFVSARSTETVALGPVTIPVPISSHQEGYTAGGSLGYSFSERERISAYYQHLVTSGSGLFAGAATDVSELSASRNFFGRLLTNFSAGFTRLSSVQKTSSSAIVGSTYQYWFAGVAMQERIGRHWSIVGSYQFNDQTATSGCAVASACGSTLHSVIFTLSWRSLPIGLGRGSREDGDTNEIPPPAPNPLVDPSSSGWDPVAAEPHNRR